jgi:hypothetical protein
MIQSIHRRELQLRLGAFEQPLVLTHDIYLRSRLNVVTGRRFLIVEHLPINAFAEQKLDPGVNLAIARDLQRMWAVVLEEPLPPDLRRLIDRLEQVTGGRSAAGRDGSV